MSKGYSTIKLNQKQHTAWITLNRPDKLNAINAVMLQELSEAIDDIEEDTNVRCVVIAGDGKVFSAGADLTELQKLTPETAEEFSAKGQQVFTKLEKMTKPVVAAIRGYALGGGLELALACDFRIASYNAQLGCPEIKLGFIPAWGGTQRLPLTVGQPAAKRLIMLGDIIRAEEAYNIGLVDKVFPSDEGLETEAEAIAQRLCGCSLEALAYAKCALNSVTKVSPDMLKTETEAFVLLSSRKETKERISDFLSQRNKK